LNTGAFSRNLVILGFGMITWFCFFDSFVVQSLIFITSFSYTAFYLKR
jgi:hypothetical protein